MKAQQLPAQQNAFRRLHLNEWTEQAERWLDLAVWDACDQAVIEEELRAPRGAFAGLRHGQRARPLRRALLFPDERRGYDVLWRFWMPREASRPPQDPAQRARAPAAEGVGGPAG
jgi:phage terminase large subunit-like protein